MKLFLGVDGGQSSTMAVMGDETGRILGLGQDGPCNHVQSAAEGHEKFVRVIGRCIGKACKQDGSIRIPVWNHPNVAWAYQGEQLHDWVSIAIGLHEPRRSIEHPSELT